MTNIKDDSYPGLVAGEPSFTLECAHIIPHYLGEESENDADVRVTFRKCANVKMQQKSKTWALLNQFSGLPLHDMLSGPLIDSTENILVLQHDNHKAFGEMRLWFTESEVQSTPVTHHWIMILIYFSILRLEFITFIFWTEAEAEKYQVSVWSPAGKDAEILWIWGVLTPASIPKFLRIYSEFMHPCAKYCMHLELVKRSIRYFVSGNSFVCWLRMGEMQPCCRLDCR